MRICQDIQQYLRILSVYISLSTLREFCKIMKNFGNLRDKS